MTSYKYFSAYVVFFSVFLNFSCKHIVVKKSIKDQYKEAFSLYQKKKFEKAYNLYNELCYKVIGKDEEIDTRYYLAMSLYNLENYKSAGKAFSDLMRLIGFSHQKSENILYMKICCIYKMVLSSKLDQSVSYKLIDYINEYFNVFPQGNYASDVKVFLDKVEKKLIKKSIAQIEFFFDRGQYKSVIAGCNNFFEENRSKNCEKIYLLKIKALGKLIDELKKTKVRDSEVLSLYIQYNSELFKSIALFKDLFDKSNYISQVEAIYNKYNIYNKFDEIT